jgi:hypothetical protein
MYCYIKSEPRLYTVGFYDPKGTWYPESDHDSPDEAAKRVAFLNGHIANKHECDHVFQTNTEMSPSKCIKCGKTFG